MSRDHWWTPNPPTFSQGPEGGPGFLDRGIADPAGELAVLHPAPDGRGLGGPGDHLQGGVQPGQYPARVDPVEAGCGGRGPRDVQRAAQGPVLDRASAEQPEVLGLVAEPEDLDVDQGGVGHLVAEPRADRLAVGRRRGRRVIRASPPGGRRGIGGGGRGRAGRLGRGGGPDADPGPAEDLVRLMDHPEGPLLAADVGVVPLRLGSIGVADLLQGRLGPHAQDRVRVELE